MLSFLSTTRVFLAAGDTDLRKSFDTLAGVVRGALKLDPLSGHLFVFTNGRRNRLKILFWDRSGFCVYYKRLEQGSFRLPKIEGGSAQLDAADLALILEGIELAGARRQKRFSLSR